MYAPAVGPFAVGWVPRQVTRIADRTWRSRRQSTSSVPAGPCALTSALEFDAVPAVSIDQKARSSYRRAVRVFLEGRTQVLPLGVNLVQPDTCSRHPT
jgi:hypothetical protein